MKKLLTFLFALMLMGTITFGQVGDVFQWIGGPVGSWQNPANWVKNPPMPASQMYPGVASNPLSVFPGQAVFGSTEDWVTFDNGTFGPIFVNDVPSCTLGRLEVTYASGAPVVFVWLMGGGMMFPAVDGNTVTMQTPTPALLATLNFWTIRVDGGCILDLNSAGQRVKLVCQPGANVWKLSDATFSPALYPLCSNDPQGPQNDYGFLLMSNTSKHAEFLEQENLFAPAPVMGWTEYYFDDQKHHYFCAPIKSEFTPEFLPPYDNCRKANSLCEFDGDYVRKYSNGAGWDNWLGAFVCWNPVVDIQLGRGYHYYGNPPNNPNGRYEFKGTFNNQTATGPAGYVTLPVTTLGWNFIGNPFPSTIKFDPPSGQGTAGEGWTWNRNNVDPIAYFWDNALNAGAGGYRYYNWYNGIGNAINQADKRLLPRSQGFFVNVAVLNVGGASDIRVGNKARIFRSDLQITKSDIGNQLFVNLKDASGKNIDDAIIHFREDAVGSNFDHLNDAFKFYNDYNNVSQLYFRTTDNVDVAMKTLQLVSGNIMYPLYMKVVNTGTYTLDVKDISTFSPNTGIILKDNKTNTTVDLKMNPVYTFNATAGDDNARFSLYFTDVLYGINKLDDNTFSVYSFENSIYIQNNDLKSTTGTVLVYDMIGKQMMQENLNGDAITRIYTNLNKGFYIVSVKTAKGVYNQKVYIN